jgi:hypothetical protein
VQQRDDAADGPVVVREDFEHAVQRGLQVERARQRLADLEQRRQAACFTGDISVDLSFEGDIFVRPQATDPRLLAWRSYIFV